MSYLLQAQWITEASDFLTQNWAKIFGILGGTSGIVAIIKAIAKILLVFVNAHYSKKNGAPLQLSFIAMKEQVLEMIDDFKLAIKESYNAQSEALKEELKQYLQELIEKSQKIKIALYDKLITEGEDANQLMDDLSNKMEEAQGLLGENSPEILPEEAKSVEDEQIIEMPKEEPQAENREVSEDIKPKRKKRKERALVER